MFWIEKMWNHLPFWKLLFCIWALVTGTFFLSGIIINEVTAPDIEIKERYDIDE